MPIEVNGISYLTASEVLGRIDVSRQTLWRWRQEGKIPAGHLYRGRKVLFGPDDVQAIQEYANRLEPLGDPLPQQLPLINGLPPDRGGEK